MKWIIGCLLALFLVAPAMAGEDPYIGIVGIDSEANPFYYSPKHLQFLYNETDFGLPDTGEGFRCNGPINKAEFCETLCDDRGNLNCKAGAGNRGYFDWVIRLPKKPSGEINICIQCAVLKPNTDVFCDAIELCAAETGERLGFGFCTKNFTGPGVDPIVPSALPMLTAIAFPGPFNSFKPFYLTAYKNPGTYKLPFWSLNDDIKSGGDSQILDGSSYARILLKACMDKCVVVKIPVSGQVTSLPAPLGLFPPSLPAGLSAPTGFSRTETELIEGDLIYVRLYVPNASTVDIFCHHESASLRGVGENPN